MSQVRDRYLSAAAKRAITVLLTAVMTAGFALAQQATIIGKLEGHTSPVYSVAWSPDGKSLATAAFDNTVRLWDAATRKEIKKFDGHTKLVARRRDFAGRQADPLGKPGQHGQDLGLAGLEPDQDARRASRTGAGSCRQAGRKTRRGGFGEIDQGLGPRDTVSRSRNSRATPATFQSAAWRGDGAGLATGDKANTHPALEGRPEPRRRDRDAERGRACPGLLAEQPADRLGGLGRTGAAVAASRRRAAKDRRRKDRWTPSRFRRMDQSWRPPAATRSSGIWNPADGKLIKEIDDRCADRRRCISARWVEACGGPCQQERADLSDGRRQGSEEDRALPAPISAIAFRGDGGQLAVAGEDNTIRVINPADGKTVKELKGHQGRIARTGVFAQGRQSVVLGLGRQDRQAVGYQSRKERSRFQRTCRCAARLEREPRRGQARHWIGRQDGPGLERRRREGPGDA